MKILNACAIVVFIFAATLWSTTIARNSTWGARKYNDELLMRRDIEKDSKWFRVIQKDVVYPPKGTPKKFVITAVHLYDRANNKDSKATLKSGGPGAQYAMICLNSAPNKPLNYTVEIYGRKWKYEH